MSNIKYGKTQGIVIKFGRNKLICDFEKYIDGAIIIVYDKTIKDKRKAYYTVRVKTDAILDRDFFENIKEISNAKTLLEKYESKLLR